VVPDMFLDEDGDNAYKELSEGPPLLPQPEIIKKDSIAIKVTTKDDIDLIIPEYETAKNMPENYIDISL